MAKQNNKNSQNQEKTNYVRISTSLLEPYEQKYFDPLVHYVPKRIQTYHLTLMTILWSLGIMVGGYLAQENLHWLWLSSVMIFFQYVTDRLDGLTGRTRNTGLVKWGYYMDHFLDFIFLASIFIGYSYLTPLSHKQLLLYTFTVFASFLVHSILRHSAIGKYTDTFFGISATELRIILIVINTGIILLGIPLFLTGLPLIFVSSLVGLIATIYKTQKRIWKVDLNRAEKPIFRKPWTALGRFALTLFIFFVCLSVYAYITNPFHPTNIYNNPFPTKVKGDTIVLEPGNKPLDTARNVFVRAFAYYKSGFHIAAANFKSERPVTKEPKPATEVIRAIHEDRFNPDKNPFLISGGHFSMLYARNNGVFYYPTLDPYSALDSQDWEQRQRIFLQTTAFGLESLRQCGSVYTTISTVGPSSATCLNIHRYPSDSLYGILYSLDTLRNNQEMIDRYYGVGASEQAPYPLQTAETAQELIDQYKHTLRHLLNDYLEDVYDPVTGLVRTDIQMSSAKDATIRQSAFYDNVVMWRTMVLADKLGIQAYKEQELQNLKKKIIATYWNENEGIFIEDRSPESVADVYYSSDWLAVLFTGFLDLRDPKEQQYYIRSLAYIHKHKIAEPFPIKYQQEDRSERDVPLVATFAPAYGGTAIWSFWGIEYIKMLILLGEETSNPAYHTEARRHLASYKDNIEKYQGFPEVYNPDGTLMDEFLYKSVISTGWVVNYEQAQQMLQ